MPRIVYNMALEQVFSEFTTKVRALYGVDDLSYMALEQVFSESAPLVRDFYEVKKPGQTVECSGVVCTKQGVACRVTLTKEGVARTRINYLIELYGVFEWADYAGGTRQVRVASGFYLVTHNRLEYAMETIGKVREKVTKVIDTYIVDTLHGDIVPPYNQERIESSNRYYRKRKNLRCKACSKPTHTKLNCGCRLCICCLEPSTFDRESVQYCRFCGKAGFPGAVIVD